MKHLKLYRGQYGQFFFDEENEGLVVAYIHENDGEYRQEYFGSIMDWAGVKVRSVKFEQLTANEIVGVIKFEGSE